MVSNLFFGLFKTKAFDSNSFLCRFIKNVGVGRLMFRLRVILFKIDNLFGKYNQRFIEYPWVLDNLGSAKGRLVLDVGCTGSLLDHELLARGFRVVGLDICEHTMRTRGQAFVKANVINTGLPSETFDVILSVSTIEHVGLNAYSQDLLSDDGDFLAMKELRRLLKPGGMLVLTLPYEGGGSCRVFYFKERGEVAERHYDNQRLSKLIDGFLVVDSAFFICLLKNNCKFVPISKVALDAISNKISEGSLGCLILQKSEDAKDRLN